MAHRKAKPRRWIQKANLKRGALHRQLGIPIGQRIPVSILKAAAKMPGVLGRRARMALNLRAMRTRSNRRR